MEIVARNTYIIGIDEAGRGPLAGPVVVAGVKINAKHKAQNAKILRGIKDSKKLSVKQREAWYGFLTRHPAIEWAVARVSQTTIDRINIRQAALLGARRAFCRLRRISFKLSFGAEKLSLDEKSKSVSMKIFLDGGLFLPHHVGVRQKTIIKGDEKIPVIAAASIIAKVTRDRMMRALHKKYPEYRFDLHKGYGTALHREMIQQYGRCEIHRKSFCAAPLHAFYW